MTSSPALSTVALHYHSRLALLCPQQPCTITAALHTQSPCVSPTQEPCPLSTPRAQGSVHASLPPPVSRTHRPATLTYIITISMQAYQHSRSVRCITSHHASTAAPPHHYLLPTYTQLHNAVARPYPYPPLRPPPHRSTATAYTPSLHHIILLQPQPQLQPAPA